MAVEPNSSVSLRTGIIAAVIVVAIGGVLFLRKSVVPDTPDRDRTATVDSQERRPGSDSPKIGRLRTESPRASSSRSRTAPTNFHAGGNTTDTAAQTTATAREFQLPLRGPSGALASNVGLNPYANSTESDAYESTETRYAKWKERGLNLIPVRIVDSTSRPLEGVRLTVDGVHQGQAGRTIGHGGWDQNRFGTPPWDVTNVEGRAYLASPDILTDLASASGISFTAFKPTYAKRRIMNYPVDGSERDEVLRRGNTLTVAAYMDTPANRVFNFIPKTSFSANLQPEDWMKMPDGRQAADSIADGKHSLTIEYEAPGGVKWHSDTVQFELQAGEAKEIEVQVKQGLTLSGVLSPNVPRPIINGKVLASAQWPPPGGAQHNASNSTQREVGAQINADGTFEIQGLPEGPGEIIGICDGWIAAHRELTARPYEQNQRYDLKPGDQTPFVLQMEETGGLRVRVLTPARQPIPGATVAVSPNVFWSTGVSTLYLDQQLWSAVTNELGFALIRGLRPGGTNYTITAKGWAPPIRVLNGHATRDQNAAIVAGINTELVNILEPVPLSQ